MNLFLSMIQRIESLSEYDSKKNRTLFLNTTQWIEPIFLNVSQIEIFVWKNSQNSQNWFFSHDPKNRTRFFSIWLKELNLFRLDSKIRCYSIWPKELNFVWIGLTQLDPFSWIWLRELKFFLGFFTCLLFSIMMQTIEPFFLWIWRKELNPVFF